MGKVKAMMNIDSVSYLMSASFILHINSKTPVKIPPTWMKLTARHLRCAIGRGCFAFHISKGNIVLNHFESSF